MIAGVFARRASQHSERLFLRSPENVLSFGACRLQVESLCRELRSRAGSRVGLVGAAAHWLVPRLIALDALGSRAYLFPPDTPTGAVWESAARLGLDAVITEETVMLPGGVAARGVPETPGEVVIFTSGTTGMPKPALHTWRGLAHRIRARPDLAEAAWLTSYHLSSFAGLQVLLHVLWNGGTLVVGPAEPAPAARLAREAGVTHVSGTPAFYRRLLLGATPADLAALSLRQITLGGEAADQAVLDALRRQFPAARITQVYASTEMGVCFSVQDGLAGFSSAYLDDEAKGARLCIVDGELYVSSAGAMRGYVEAEGLRPTAELFPTGDLVERRGDRVVFVGRRGDRINVGGNKAFPEEIEAAVREVPGVRTVRVSGVPSSLMGQIVRAEIVLDGGVDAGEARRRIVAHCRRRLRPHMVPRLVDFVDEIGQTAGGKLLRR